MEVITYEIPQKVRVRKYSVDYERLCELLRRHKKTSGLSNKAIAESLNVPITKVEHWFRQDSSFAIPDEELWIKIKELLQIDSTEFDESIMTFVEKDSVFEKGNRIYDSVGIAPTITCGDAAITVLERIDDLEVKVLGDMFQDNGHGSMAGRVYDTGGQCPALGASHFQQIKYILERKDKLEVKSLGNICKDNWVTGFPGNVWDKEKLCPTLSTMQGGYRQPMIVDEVKRIGNLSDTKSQSRTVYDSDGISPTLCSGMDKGNTMPHIFESTIVAMRGRNPENPSDRTVGSPTEQRLEPNSQGICNTLTSVQKDNLVMEKVCYIDEQNMNTRNDVVGTLTTDGSSPKHNNRVLETVRIKQATKEGYIECKIGGVADLLYPSSTTRRGRVQDNGDVSPTITSMENGLYKIESQYRIRKLTPRECWRLMDFTDADFDKAAEVNSNTQLYKQAGNSIVKNVLVAIFGQMIPGKENVYKEIQKHADES